MPARDIDWRAPPEFDDLLIHGRKGKDQSRFKTYHGGACSVRPRERISVDNCYDIITDRIRKQKDKFVIFDLPGKGHESINNYNMLFQKYFYEKEMPHLGQHSFPELFGDIFRVVFQPIPVMAEDLNKTMTLLGLVEGECVSAHVRSGYPSNFLLKKFKKKKSSEIDNVGGFPFEEVKSEFDKVATNAIDCVVQRAPGFKTFFLPQIVMNLQLI